MQVISTRSFRPISVTSIMLTANHRIYAACRGYELGFFSFPKYCQGSELTYEDSFAGLLASWNERSSKTHTSLTGVRKFSSYLMLTDLSKFINI